MPPKNRRTNRTRPDPDALAAASATAGESRLSKAPDVDPVLGQPSNAEPPAETKKAPNLQRTKVGFYIDKGDADRARAAFNNLPAGVRPRSWSDFLADAVMAQVNAYEAEYNHGEPWEPLEPGNIATGKPLGG